MIDVERSQPAPTSLAKQTDYNAPDVRERLRADFHDKCYLCETIIGSNFVVDHRQPKGDGGGVHDWNNLFPACNRCNEHRQKKWPQGGLISPGDGVETLIHQFLDDELEPGFAARDQAHQAAVNTAHELERMHRHPNQDRDVKMADLRAAIRAQAIHVYKLSHRLYALQTSGQTSSNEYLEGMARLRKELSRRAPYTMLVRSLFQSRAALFD